jgi:hypothetical protein
MAKTNVIVIIGAISMLMLVLELVRRRRLREEYSWLWLFTALFYMLVAAWPGFATWLTNTLGASNPSTVFTFLGLQFLILILIQFSIQLSKMKTQIKDLTQELAILDSTYLSAEGVPKYIDPFDGDTSIQTDALQEQQIEEAPLEARYHSIQSKPDSFQAFTKREET